MSPIGGGMEYHMQKIVSSDFSSIQQAIDKCAADGGGTVYIPKGEWHSGSIHLKSHVHIQLDKEAVISFSDVPEEYLPVVFTRWEGVECYNYSSLIYARDCEDIGITGEGRLLGNGQAWWAWKKLQQEAANELCYAQSNGNSVEKRVYGTREAALRPSFIQLIGCENVVLSDFTIEDGPQWTIHPVYCEHVTVRDVKVITHGPNTDGLNPDSCTDVLIEGCSFETGDDCIAINAGMNEDGWRVGKPCRDIVIRKCMMSGGHGAVVIGSAISGGVENVKVTDCTVKNTMQGIRIKTMRGRGGYVRNALFRNIEINDVSNQAVQINSFYEFSTVKPLTDTPSELSDIIIEDVHGGGADTAIEIKGLPEKPLQKISLKNINLTADKAMTVLDVDNICIENVKVNFDTIK